MSWLLCLSLAALSGCLYALSFPPPAVAWLEWVALVPLLFALDRAPLSRAIAAGCVWSVSTFAGTGYSLAYAIEGYYQQPLWAGWLFLGIVTLITALPWYTLFTVAWSRLSRNPTWTLPVLTGTAWAAVELLRIRVVGNPWGVAGYAQGLTLPLTQIADVTGVLGLSFLVAAVNGAIFVSMRATRDSARRRAAFLGALPVAAALGLTLAYGLDRLATFDTDENSPGATSVAVIQPNLPTETAWLPELYGQNLRHYFRMTADAVDASDADLVIWPETAMHFALENEPAYQSSLATLLEPLDVELVAGSVRWQGEGESPDYFNTTYLLDPKAEIVARYDKRRLLPFAEFFPWWMPDLNRRNFSGVREFTAGAPLPPLPTIAGDAGVLVCNEAFYGHQASDRSDEGAQLLLNPANDSWMGVDSYALQAFRITHLRAIEQRRFLVRTSTSGPSAIVDPAGRVLALSGASDRAWLSGTVAPLDGTTVYRRVGDAFGVLCLLVTVVALVFSGASGVAPADASGDEAELVRRTL